jgi:hypothetical protein
MFVPLVLLGVVLIVFGAFVLLRYSDRPGATVKWLGAELSSNGAGLPLIMLGVGCIAFAALRFPPGGHSTRDSTTVATSSSPVRKDGTCIDEWLSGIPRDRIDTVEAGMRDLEVIGSHQPLEQPFVLLLTDNGKLIGALRVRLYRASNHSSDLYKIEDAIDAQCSTIEDIRNASRGGNPRELVNWDNLGVTLGGKKYELTIGGEVSIGVNFSRTQ